MKPHRVLWMFRFFGCLLGFLCWTPVWGFQVQSTAEQAGNKVVRWNVSPIRIELHLDGAPAINDGSDLRAIRDAFATWAQPTCNNLAFDFQLTNNTSFAGNRKDPSDPLSEFTRDGKSVVRFETQQWEWSKLELARNANHFDPQTGILKEADLLFNAVDFKWSTDQTVGTIDIQTIALARIGMMLGLWFSEVPGALLHPSTDLRLTQRTLSQDDIDGSCFLYPTSGWKDVPPPKPAEFPAVIERPSSSQENTSGGFESSTSPSDGGTNNTGPEINQAIEPGISGGCQCQSHPQMSGWWLLLLLGVVGGSWRRRRTEPSHAP